MGDQPLQQPARDPMSARRQVVQEDEKRKGFHRFGGWGCESRLRIPTPALRPPGPARSGEQAQDTERGRDPPGIETQHVRRELDGQLVRCGARKRALAHTTLADQGDQASGLPEMGQGLSFGVPAHQETSRKEDWLVPDAQGWTAVSHSSVALQTSCSAGTRREDGAPGGAYHSPFPGRRNRDRLWNNRWLDTGWVFSSLPLHYSVRPADLSDNSLLLPQTDPFLTSTGSPLVLTFVRTDT